MKNFNKEKCYAMVFQSDKKNYSVQAFIKLVIGFYEYIGSQR